MQLIVRSQPGLSSAADVLALFSLFTETAGRCSLGKRSEVARKDGHCDQNDTMSFVGHEFSYELT